MKQSLLSFLKTFIPFSILLYLGQYFIIKEFASEYIFIYNTWSIYTFHIIATFIIFITLLAVQKASFDNTGFAFLACGLLKMLASIVFLVPLIKADLVSKLPDITAFFIPYFLFLTFETVFALKLINDQ